MSINTQAIRDGYDLRDFVARALGAPLKQSREYHTFYCPFHNEKSGSLQVWDDHFKCFGCAAGGDIIKFVELYEHKSFLEAIEFITGEATPRSTPRPAPAARPVVDFTPEALAAAQRADIALPYMARRGIEKMVALDHLTGAVIDYEHDYYFSPAEKEPFRCLRYSLPNMLQSKCRSINYRRDDDTVMDAFSKIDQRLIKAIRDSEARKERAAQRDPHILSFDELIDLMFGEKYLRAKHSQVRLYNADLLLQPQPPSYILVNEGKEIDVMSLLSQGYPAVGYPQSNAIEASQVFDRVPMKYILADNDANGAGYGKALWIREKLGGGMILVPPPPFKDANDLAVAGELKSWLSQHGIVPVL